jgi:hypothetical protein
MGNKMANNKNAIIDQTKEDKSSFGGASLFCLN